MITSEKINSYQIPKSKYQIVLRTSQHKVKVDINNLIHKYFETLSNRSVSFSTLNLHP